jgi:hypothetical protein
MAMATTMAGRHLSQDFRTCLGRRNICRRLNHLRNAQKLIPVEVNNNNNNNSVEDRET